MGRIDAESRVDIVALHKFGYSTRDIVLILNGRGKDVIRDDVRYVVKLYESGKFDPSEGILNERSPNYYVVSERDITVIGEVLSSGKQMSSKDVHCALKEDGADFSLSTTKYAIKAAGFIPTKPVYGPMVSDTNKRLRSEFCLDLIRKNDTFNDVIFSDESTIQLNGYNQYGYKPIDSVDQRVPKPKHPAKLHVWGGISRRGATGLVVFEDIMDSEFYTHAIIRDALLPFIRAVYPDGHRFQQDNDPKHRSKMTRNFMDANGIVYPKWPAQSPDLNPIEMVWAQLKAYVNRIQPRTKDGLSTCIREFWSNTMSVELCNR